MFQLVYDFQIKNYEISEKENFEIYNKCPLYDSFLKYFNHKFYLTFKDLFYFINGE